MSPDEINFDLFAKMDREQQVFLEWLVLQSPEEVMRRAYEYVVKSDILSSMEDITLSEEHARALLSSATPLEDLYRMHNRDWASAKNRIEETIHSCAEQIIEVHTANKAVEVYPHSELYAEDFNEWEQYQQSTHLNIQCKEAIEEAISQYYNYNHLDPEAVHQVAEAYGVPRMRFVLANSVLDQIGDQRIDAAHKAWARSVPVFADTDDEGRNKRAAYTVRSHPELLNAFISTLHKEYPLAKELEKKSLVEALKVKPKKIRRNFRRISTKVQER